jgi:hypothetical protein
MKSITIHNMDESLARIIQRKAEETGLSLNKTIQMLLRQAVGLSPQPEKDKRKPFEDLFGLWDEAEFRQFQANIEDLGKVDPEDWQ